MRKRIAIGGVLCAIVVGAVLLVHTFGPKPEGYWWREVESFPYSEGLWLRLPAEVLEDKELSFVERWKLERRARAALDAYPRYDAAWMAREATELVESLPDGLFYKKDYKFTPWMDALDIDDRLGDLHTELFFTLGYVKGGPELAFRWIMEHHRKKNDETREFEQTISDEAGWALVDKYAETAQYMTEETIDKTLDHIYCIMTYCVTPAEIVYVQSLDDLGPYPYYRELGDAPELFYNWRDDLELVAKAAMALFVEKEKEDDALSFIRIYPYRALQFQYEGSYNPNAYTFTCLDDRGYEDYEAFAEKDACDRLFDSKLFWGILVDDKGHVQFFINLERDQSILYDVPEMWPYDVSQDIPRIEDNWYYTYGHWPSGM
ncbi:hypothetical protein LJC32_03120 [Oscillospiraceae bacterium OttesenSCG-928-F05]|nr:hypothetical protein [Oscillospiraceae bacterium OttesenSCG-928-F05]